MATDEDLLEPDEIQGNILAGFNKDYQVFLFMRMSREPGDLPPVRTWLRTLATQVSTVAEVHRFNMLFKAMRKRTGDEPTGLVATWLNVAFSAPALRTLTSDDEVKGFSDEFFRDGLASRSGRLGDPIDEAAVGHPTNWVVGGTHNEADIVIIIASDRPELLNERLTDLKLNLPKQLTISWEQRGETLDDPLTGHEHFGFKDGVSQPAVRGLMQESPPTFLARRRIDPAQSPQSDPKLPEFAAPGQPLIWPGQFVFGYRRQNNDDAREPKPIANECPDWGRNGSYLVIRRLRQDVAAFRAFMRAQAAKLAAEPGFGELSATKFAAMCVGRWPSGAPIMRSPSGENTYLGKDPYAENFFQYVHDSPSPFPLVPEVEYAGDAFPISKSDDKGIVCPFSSHIRKINPRDTITEQGNSTDVLARLILRRGIPYGRPLPGSLEEDDPASPAEQHEDRGLMFVSYQTSIESQFVFLQEAWANHNDNPNGGGGHDPIIGQGDRSAGGNRSFFVRAAGQPTREIDVKTEWVTPTGGGFFFSPSITAIATILGRAE